MVAALMYRGLERNTPGPVGRASNLCTSIQAVNPEIAAIQQHQDPASPGAAETNKAVALELARQIQSVGGDPLEALKSGTFQPGDVTDATGKGNTCDDFDDPVGCIFTKNLIVEDVTADEILAAAGGAIGASGATGMSANTGAAMGAAMGADMSANTGAATGAATGAGMGGNAAGSGAVMVQGGFQPAVLKASGGDQSGCASNQVNTLAEAQGAAAATGGAAAAPTGLDFGSCPNAGIVFGPGFDGRKENSFQPADKTQFTQGSALSKLPSHFYFPYTWRAPIYAGNMNFG
jgi:hypothetical protein